MHMQKVFFRCDLVESNCMNGRLETRFSVFGAVQGDAWERPIPGIFHLWDVFLLPQVQG